ncbi:hypothetical protein MD484_g8775, partial [Candolleomyces efflorescens]
MKRISNTMNLLAFPEELLERILEEVVLYPQVSPAPSQLNEGSSTSMSTMSTSWHAPFYDPEAPSRSLGPSPISTPSSTPKSSPSATRRASPHSSPVRSRPASPPWGTGSANTASSSPNPASSSASGSSRASHTSSISSRPQDVRAEGGSSSQLERVLAPLLTCRQISRIALPLYYRVVILRSRHQARQFLESGLGYDPYDRLRDEEGRRTKQERARWIRRLVVCGIWQEAGEVLRILAGLVESAQLGHQPSLTVGGSMKRNGKGKAKGRGAGKGKARADAGSGEFLGVVSCSSVGTIALKVLEITIDAAPPRTLGVVPGSYLGETLDRGAAWALKQEPDHDADGFANALRAFAASWGASSDLAVDTQERGEARTMGQNNSSNPLKHLVLRKPQNVYLTLPRVKNLIGAVADVVEASDKLEEVFVAFKLSDDPTPSLPVPALAGQQPPADDPVPPGPITRLTEALSTRPKLKTFATMLPSVWNEAVLRVSKNEALEKIVLLGSNGAVVCPPQAPQVPHPLHYAPPLASSSGSPGSPGSSRRPARPRLAVVLPSNPVERVYANSARGVDGYAPTTLQSSSTAPPHQHTSTGSMGYGGGTAFYAPGQPTGYGMGTGLFMNQAKKWDRLWGLIGAGARVGVEPSPSSSSDDTSSQSVRHVKDTGPTVVQQQPLVSTSRLGGPQATGALHACSSWFAVRFSSSD